VPEFIRLSVQSGVPPPAPVERVHFMGRHLILDLWEANGLNNEKVIERALRDSVAAAGAMLLHIHLHRFEPNGGVSGVAVLAESHISIHSWPERRYAALDVFMCGGCDPEKAVPVLRRAFTPKFIVLSELRRGGGGVVA
jgi:S-adenosylmethionine decarboxylase